MSGTINNSESETIETNSQPSQKNAIDGIADTLGKIQVKIDNGGVAGILLKGLMYVVLPFALFAALAGGIYYVITNKKVFLEYINAKNKSKVYSDDTTDWQIEVERTEWTGMSKDDRESFNRVKEKLKGIYL